MYTRIALFWVAFLTSFLENSLGFLRTDWLPFYLFIYKSSLYEKIQR